MTELAGERLGALYGLAREKGWQSVLIYGNAWRCDYLRYATGFALLEGHGFALMDQDGTCTFFLESPGEAERASIETRGLRVLCEPDFFGRIRQRIHDLGNQRLAAVPLDIMPRAVAEALPSGVEDCAASLDLLLMAKLEGEIACCRRAAALADEGYEMFCAAARPGRAEFELVAEIEGFFRERGCPDNFMIVGSGGREVRGMHPPGDRRLQPGDLVTTELTPCTDGYYAQLCRTLVIGAPSAAQQTAFDLFLESMEAGLAAVRPGVTAGAIADAENAVFAAHGLGAYTMSDYTRVRGHGLGLFPDSPPALLPNIATPLVEGMTMIVHPNTYHPEVGYIVLGDSIVVRADGPEILTRTPRRLISVPA